jgi:hypothetical protein
VGKAKTIADWLSAPLLQGNPRRRNGDAQNPAVVWSDKAMHKDGVYSKQPCNLAHRWQEDAKVRLCTCFPREHTTGKSRLKTFHRKAQAIHGLLSTTLSLLHTMCMRHVTSIVRLTHLQTTNWRTVFWAQSRTGGAT